MNSEAFLMFLTNIETNAESIYVRAQVNGRWCNKALAELSAREALRWVIYWFETTHRLQMNNKQIIERLTKPPEPPNEPL